MRATIAVFVFVVAFSLEAPAEAADSCQHYRAELARLGHGGMSQQTGRLVQFSQYRQSLGCSNSGGFFLFRPPECDTIDQQISALRAYDADEGRIRQQRSELHALIRKFCEAPSGEAAGARGGSQLICVRTCDGGYFPIDWSAKDETDPDQFCQALCPGAAAAAYSMPPGDDGLQEAASVQSKAAYSALPNAFKFQKEAVPACTCRVKDESWSNSLQKAEDMLPEHKADTLVTPALAEQLSRPGANALAILAKFNESTRLADRVSGRHSVHVAYHHSSRRIRREDFASPEPTAFTGVSVRSSYASPFSVGPYQ
jgi:Protein of unknown function (DUF2865)